MQHYSHFAKLALFLPSLRQEILPHENLLAGPFAGEFGWELMQWQGFVRRRRPHYKQVHVLTYPGRDYLYEGCAVHAHQIDLKDAGYGYGHLHPAVARQMAQRKAEEVGLRDYDIFGTHLLCTQYHRRFWGQDFRLFEQPSQRSGQYDVVFHFRSVQKIGPDQAKNYPVTLADELATRCLNHGLRIGCIGHPGYSYAPCNSVDHRSIDLQQTAAAISSARMVAGENSGPMHLANLCGKPTVIWAQDQWRIDYSLRWNPFRVPIYVAANTTHHPSPELVCRTIVDALADIEKRSDGFMIPLYTLPAQRIANY